jgi:predicted  nucleic acid-binding Zn-ribbon protein
VGDELKSIRDDLEHLRNWKRKIEEQVELAEQRLTATEARVVRLEAQRELRLAGGRDVGSTNSDAKS